MTVTMRQPTTQTKSNRVIFVSAMPTNSCKEMTMTRGYQKW
jgi:hypothetical protein